LKLTSQKALIIVMWDIGIVQVAARNGSKV